MAINFRSDPWTIRTNGKEYKALGYEQRGIFSIPIADFVGDIPIQCTVYEAIHQIIPAEKDHFYSITRPNNAELVLLKEAGWMYDGSFIHYVGEC